MSITVIVPSFNHEKYIKTCILSIVNQSFKNFKLIVIDDGSTDNSAEILRSLSIKYHFRLVIQENLGLAKTFNKAITEYVDTEFVTFCASDDFWHKDKLLLQYNFMKNNPYCLMCYGKMHLINEFDEICQSSHNNKTLKGGDIFDSLFLLKFHLPVTYFFRSEAFKRVGLYDEKLFAEDFDMNLRISSISSIGYIDEFLGYYRFVEISSKLLRYDRVVDSHLASINKFRSHILYKEAKKKVLLGRLYAYSTIKTKKIKAICLFLLLRKFLFSKTYIKSVYNFIFIWR